MDQDKGLSGLWEAPETALVLMIEVQSPATAD
jgi:hypothetical protein